MSLRTKFNAAMGKVFNKSTDEKLESVIKSNDFAGFQALINDPNFMQGYIEAISGNFQEWKEEGLSSFNASGEFVGKQGSKITVTADKIRVATNWISNRIQDAYDKNNTNGLRFYSIFLGSSLPVPEEFLKNKGKNKSDNSDYLSVFGKYLDKCLENAKEVPEFLGAGIGYASNLQDELAYAMYEKLVEKAKKFPDAKWAKFFKRLTSFSGAYLLKVQTVLMNARKPAKKTAVKEKS